MGVVSAAFDTVRGHEVAIKRLSVEKFPAPRDLSQATALFEREYYTLAELAHPQIIEVYDYGFDEQGPYYTMQRLHGRSLLDEAPMAPREACSVIRDVCSALALVHSRRFVHRDVTPLNIHRAPEGGTKLIDFGAMMPMGVPKNLVGTPPFVAPECTALQALDERTDIYSLGACLYFALTGRHAYPARSVRGLREAWRYAPAPPSTLAPNVPEALDQLVLSLLSLKPAGRPSTAAEVFERLTTIADLPRDEQIEVAQAYVTSPALAGREIELTAIRRRALKASRGRGGSVLIDGSAGVGRSRLLDAGALVARLSGLTVARADSSDALTPFGVARRLLRVFLESAKVERRAKALGLSGWIRGEAGEGAGNESREKILRDASALLLEACALHASAIVIDDLHLIDEPSLALIVSLATQVRGHGLLLVTTVDSDSSGHIAATMALLTESSTRLSLEALDEPSSRALLSSIFGEGPGLDTLSAVTYRRCRGNPRELMDAAQRLIDQRLVRYEGGSWLIAGAPDALERALPRDDAAAHILERLSSDAAELLAALSLDRDVVMCLADYPTFTLHGDGARVNRALDELIRAQLVTPAEDRHPFRREAHRKGVAESLGESRRREMHRRLAERAALIPIPRVYEAYHFLKAGLPLRAIEPIERYRDFVEAEPNSDIIRNPITLEMLEEISLLPEREEFAALRAEHGAGLVMNAAYQGAPERAVPHVRRVLQALSWFTGLTDYQALEDPDIVARLGQAMGIANARCSEAGLPSMNPISAIRRLSQVSLATAVCARFMADPNLLSIIPDLTPFVPLSPAIGIASTLIGALGKLVRGQDWEAWDAMEQAYTDLHGSLGDEIDPLTRMGLERVLLGYLCSLEAEHAAPTASLRIEEYAPFMPNLAESLRARHCLALGDVAGAALARRRFETLSVQTNGLAEARILELPAYLNLHALSDDIMGIKRTMDAMSEVVRTRPCWGPRLALARSHFLRCQGELAEALAVIEASLSALDDGHGDWAPSAAAHVDLLNRTGRFEDARRVGSGYLEHARLLRVPMVRLDLALAMAHAELDDATAAERHFEAARSSLEARGVGGMHLGHLYEIGARIAIARRDRRVFALRATACAEHYCAGMSPSLTAKYDALMKHAERCNLAVDGVPRSASSPPGDASAETAMSPTGAPLQVSTSVESWGPHQEVLALLVARAGALGGFLYTNSTDGLQLTGVTPGFDPPDDLDAAVAAFFADQVEPEGQTLYTPAGDRLTPWLLECHRDGARLVPGAVFLAIADGPARRATEAVAAAAIALAAEPGIVNVRAAPK